MAGKIRNLVKYPPAVFATVKILFNILNFVLLNKLAEVSLKIEDVEIVESQSGRPSETHDFEL